MTIPPVPDTAADAAPPAPAKRRPWWHTNLAALIALVVLLPVTAATVGWQEWYQYFGFGTRSVTAVPVEEHETTELADAVWGPLRGGEITDAEGLNVPTDARVLAVGVPVAPSRTGIACETPMLVEQSTGREWRPMRAEIGVGYDSGEPETCLSEQVEPYELILPFVVPEDATGPFWVDVRPYDADGSFVRFSFEP